ncbi:GntR family transcriptional regulator [Streptomyces sp. NBC_00669]|uniref:GntR family transcriptional regulator n=1 Tax=unclassified Streptomyces TaxID=2593676 RepID=UPI002E348FA2|nr:GntR family transcriptional regulator [Streptomyces sp. NBC_00669]
MERAAPIVPPARVPERLSVRDQVLDALRAAIVSGRLAPGSVHSAPELAERYRVSATPVREAMQLLAREGAVEVLPNRGFRVAEHTARDLAELAEVRALLEGPVVLGLTRTVPVARWERLRPLADEAVVLAVRGDLGGYAEADRAFHRAVLQLSGNLHLVAVADEVHRRTQWPAALPQRKGGGVRDRDRLVADATEHCVLLDAVASGEEGAVADAVRRHFGGGAVGEGVHG